MIAHNHYAALEDLVFQYGIFKQINDEEGMNEMEQRMMLCVTPALLVEMINELQDLECQVMETGERD